MRKKIENSIIIPVFNGISYLPLFWDTLNKYILPNSEIIIIDDGSTQNIVEAMPGIKNHPNTEIIRHEYPNGFSKSVNDGLKKSKGKFLFILNSDLILQENTLLNLKQAFKNDKKIGIVGATLLYPQTGKVQHAGIAFSETNHFHIFSHANRNHPLVLKRRYVQSIAFALCCMPRKVLNTVGLLNENYFNSYEDFDYCFRTMEKKYLIAVEPKSLAFHWERQAGIIRSVLRKDNVARLWRDWGRKIDPDLHKYIMESWEFFKEHHNYFEESKLAIINLSRGREAHNIINFLLSPSIKLQILEVSEFQQRSNNSYKLWLPQIMPVDSISNPYPYLYIVDEYPQLLDNIYWFDLRKHFVKDEIILDHRANFFSSNSLFKFA